jgi:hypothetical protein
MTELTPRQILDAIREALEETARRFSKDKPELAPEQEPRPTDAVAKQSTQSRRQSMTALYGGLPRLWRMESARSLPRGPDWVIYDGLPKSLTSPLDLGSLPYRCVAANRRVAPQADIEPRFHHHQIEPADPRED